MAMACSVALGSFYTAIETYCTAWTGHQPAHSICVVADETRPGQDLRCQGKKGIAKEIVRIAQMSAYGQTGSEQKNKVA
jgi:hypothetical protein